MSYGFYIKHFYYSGTLNAPVSGLMRSEWSGEIIAVSSRRDAEFILEKLILKQCANGFYFLSHGEYAMPEYTIRGTRAQAVSVVGASAALGLTL